MPLEHRAAKYRALAESGAVSDLIRAFETEPDQWLRKLISMLVSQNTPSACTQKMTEALALNVRTSL